MRQGLAPAIPSRMGRPPLSRGRSAGNKRWFFGVDKFQAGPVEFSGLGVGSGERSRGMPYCSENMVTRSRGAGSMVGLGTRAVDVQSVMPSMSREMRGDTAIQVLRGTEFLQAITTPSSPSTDVGALLAVIAINPTAFLKTRIAQFAPLFQRYRFRKLNFIYEPIANATQSGQIIGFGDYDFDNQITTNSEDNVRQAAAHINQSISQIWEPRSFPFGILDDFTTLFTNLNGGENRLIYQGVFYLIAASFLGPEFGIGNIYIEYECEFSIQQLAVEDVPGTVLSLVAGTGSAVTWNELFVGLSSEIIDDYQSNLNFTVTTEGTVTVPLPPGGYLLNVSGKDAVVDVASSTVLQFYDNLDTSASDAGVAVTPIVENFGSDPSFQFTPTEFANGVINNLSMGSSYFIFVTTPVLGGVLNLVMDYTWSVGASSGITSTAAPVVTLSICAVSPTDIVPSAMRQRAACALVVAKPKWQAQIDNEVSDLRRQLKLLQGSTRKSSVEAFYPTRRPAAETFHSSVMKDLLTKRSYDGPSRMSPCVSQHKFPLKRKVLKVVEVDESSEDEKV